MGKSIQIKKFDSRKNEVFLNDDNTITKRFKDPLSYLKEAEILKKLDGFYSPQILSADNQEIIMTNIDGKLLLEKYLDDDLISAEETGTLLGKTMIYLYNQLDKQIPYDENFRNYIIKKNKVYRVDFEETRDGSLEEWCGKVLAFAILYDVKQEVKSSFMISLIEAIELEPEEVIDFYTEEIERLVNRRKIIYPSKKYQEIEDIVFGVWEEE